MLCFKLLQGSVGRHRYPQSFKALRLVILIFPKDKHKGQKWLKIIFLGLAFTLQLYNHYFSALLAVIMGVSGFLFIQRKQLLPYLIAGIIASLLYLPHIPISLNHFSIGGVGEWLGKPDKTWILDHILYIFN